MTNSHGYQLMWPIVCGIKHTWTGLHLSTVYYTQLCSDYRQANYHKACLEHSGNSLFPQLPINTDTEPAVLRNSWWPLGGSSHKSGSTNLRYYKLCIVENKARQAGVVNTDVETLQAGLWHKLGRWEICTDQRGTSESSEQTCFNTYMSTCTRLTKNNKIMQLHDCML